jgi:hypothetical protein
MAPSDPNVDGERYLRQILLPEIGASGQSMICSAVAEVAGEGLAAEVAVRYARTAGFAVVSAGALEIDALAPKTACAFEASRSVLAGARAALAQIRLALGRDRYAPRTDVPPSGDGAAP